MKYLRAFFVSICTLTISLPIAFSISKGKALLLFLDWAGICVLAVLLSMYFTFILINKYGVKKISTKRPSSAYLLSIARQGGSFVAFLWVVLLIISTIVCTIFQLGGPIIILYSVAMGYFFFKTPEVQLYTEKEAVDMVIEIVDRK